MIRIVSWNISKSEQPWRELAQMARQEEADVALLQEAGNAPGNLVHPIRYESGGFWEDQRCNGQPFYDRWCRVVQLSDGVKVDWFRQVAPFSELGEHDIAVSGIGTVAAARVTPRDGSAEPIVVVSMYARWIRSHPSAGKRPGLSADGSAHRILSDLMAFIDYDDPSRHRILAAGDLNMIYGTTGRTMTYVQRERTVWDRFEALGLEFLGPQAPNGRAAASPQPGVPGDSRNVPTFHTSQQSPADAERQLDYVFASRGFHESIRVRALNGEEEWGSSDHCRVLIEIGDG